VSVEEVHSGGQTGGDQGGLGAAYHLGLRTGGWAPKGYLTENGPNMVLRNLGLREHESPTYPPRTKLNVEDTDGTLIFGSVNSPGCRLTKRFTDELKRPLIIQAWASGDPVPFEFEVAAFREWLVRHEITVLNVAGNRESKQPGITRATFDFLVAALRGMA